MAEGNQQPPPAPSTAGVGEDKWETRHMGPPAAPSTHPHNQQAASAIPTHEDVPPPYLLDRTPVDKSTSSPIETILDYFNTWTAKTETIASNVWFNRKSRERREKGGLCFLQVNGLFGLTDTRPVILLMEALKSWNSQ